VSNEHDTNPETVLPTGQLPIGELPAVGATTPAPRSANTGHGTTLSLAETATRLQMSVRTVRRMVQAGKLEGAHMVPGKYGETWQVPVATVEQHLAGAHLMATNAPPGAHVELKALRDRVSQLERDLELQRTLADERRHQLEQLHMTMRMLTAGQNPPPSTPAPSDQAAPRQRGWRSWRR